MCLQDEQAPINIEIVESALSSTPGHWDHFSLNLQHVSAANPDELGSVIVSLHNGEEPCPPNDGLFEATLKLLKLFHRYGISWISARYDISMIGDGKWKFETDFQY